MGKKTIKAKIIASFLFIIMLTLLLDSLTILAFQFVLKALEVMIAHYTLWLILKTQD